MAILNSTILAIVAAVAAWYFSTRLMWNLEWTSYWMIQSGSIVLGVLAFALIFVVIYKLSTLDKSVKSR